MVFFGNDRPARKPVHKDLKKMLHDRQGGKCMYCGIKLGIEHMHLDHRNPRKGNSVTNLQMLCARCNTRKSDRTDGQFRRRYSDILKPARLAKGPPARRIPYLAFDAIDRELKARRRKAKASQPWGFF